MDEGTNKHQATTTQKDNRSHSSWRLLQNFSNATFVIFFLVRIITKKNFTQLKKNQHFVVHTFSTYLYIQAIFKNYIIINLISIPNLEILRSPCFVSQKLIPKINYLFQAQLLNSFPLLTQMDMKKHMSFYPSSISFQAFLFHYGCSNQG